MTLPELQAYADRINTGATHPDTSRALVIFNLTDTPVNGIAVFRAAMSWPADKPLPPVAVTEMDGEQVPTTIYEFAAGRDSKGRADRSQLTFALHFAVTDIPACGWRTYIASYADAPSPPLENGAKTADLVVVETMRHGGDLLPAGNF